MANTSSSKSNVSSKKKVSKKENVTPRQKKDNLEGKNLKKVTPKKSPTKKQVVEKKVEEKNKKINTATIISIVMVLLSIIIIVLSVSFGFFTYTRKGKQQSTVYTANLNIVVNDQESLGIDEDNAFPIYDEVGRKTDPYEFTLENLGSVAANYVMRLVPDTKAIKEDLCEDNLIAEGSLKIQLIKDDVVIKEARISELDDYIIDSGFIGLAEEVRSYSYKLRVWITSDTGKEVMGRHYHGKIQVDVIDPNNS